MQPRAYTVFCIILREWFCCQKEAEASPSPAQESPNLNDEDTDNYFDELDEEELERLINMNNEDHRGIAGERGTMALQVLTAGSNSSSYAS
jgi:hypothetical protein